MTPPEPRVGCGVALIRNDRILLLKRKTDPESGCWGIPGGKVDLFETAEQAARREMREEAGVGADDLTLLCLVDQIDRIAGVHWISPVYLAMDCIGTPRLMETTKHSGLDWFELDHLPPRLTIATREAVAAFRQGSPRVSL